jgi:indole-3-glycerol phosphate synthase
VNLPESRPNASGGLLAEIVSAARQRAAALSSRGAALERAAANAAVGPSFGAALAGRAVAVIAEIKRRSPSAGDIQPALDPARHAAAYAAGGAAAISVLTDPSYFGGSLEDLVQVVRATTVPVLRKDFIVHELQIVEARAAGASAVLLIARVLPPRELRILAARARGLGLGTLIEVHTAAEVEDALAAEPTAVGINSRDLATFTVDPVAALRLVAHVPAGTPAVAESGIVSRDDVVRAASAGADAVLVGTAVARAANPGGAVRALVGVAKRGRG